LLAPCVRLLHDHPPLGENEGERQRPLFPNRRSPMRLDVSMVIIIPLRNYDLSIAWDFLLVYKR
jgi:hypothetical protein